MKGFLRAGVVCVVDPGPGAGPHLLRDGALQPALAQGADPAPHQGWKLLSCSHCQELCQQARWLLIGYTKVNNQSEAS